MVEVEDFGMKTTSRKFKKKHTQPQPKLQTNQPLPNQKPKQELPTQDISPRPSRPKKQNNLPKTTKLPTREPMPNLKPTQAMPTPSPLPPYPLPTPKPSPSLDRLPTLGQKPDQTRKKQTSKTEKVLPSPVPTPEQLPTLKPTISTPRRKFLAARRMFEPSRTTNLPEPVTNSVPTANTAKPIPKLSHADEQQEQQHLQRDQKPSKLAKQQYCPSLDITPSKKQKLEGGKEWRGRGASQH